MAKTVSVVTTDDLDGSPDAETFIDAGRRTAHRRTAKSARGTGPRTDRAAVRAWAAGQGLKVSERGRISAEVLSKYNAAH